MDFRNLEDYKKGVIEAYKKKRSEGILPPNLKNHTTANLYKECLNVFHNRFSSKDSETFKELYGERNSAAEYLQRIKASGADKFKPLDNFLKGNTNTPKTRYIELLAWLIDFEPRPHQIGNIYGFLESNNNIEGKSEHSPKQMDYPNLETVEKKHSENKIQDEIDKDLHKDDKRLYTSSSISNPSKRILGIPRKFYKTIVALFVIVTVICASSIYYRLTHQCMYWNSERYQLISCHEKIGSIPVVSLDTTRYDHLQKILNISSITRNDIGKVHYSKIDGVVEFYTTGGTNPTDTNRRLLPMTAYMFNKYVLHQ